MKTFAAILVGMICALGTSTAWGNDSSALLASGGLEFVQQDHVVMQSEDLTITPDLISVRYVFRNTASRDITTIVAFPLPEIGAITDFDNYILPDEEGINFIDFRTKVDGRPIEMKVERRAIALGLDRTDVLKARGLPLEPYRYSTREVLMALPADSSARLEEMGLLRRYTDYVEPAWTLQTTYYWDQVFPAGRDLVIEHQYKPVTGRSLSPPLPLYADHDDYTLKAKEDYCISDVLEKTMLDTHKDTSGTNQMAYVSGETEYILKTGANWSGPIRNFHLIVEAAKPGDFAFLCLDGLNRVSRSRLELKQKNFWPREDLKALFIETVEFN